MNSRRHPSLDHFCMWPVFVPLRSDFVCRRLWTSTTSACCPVAGTTLGRASCRCWKHNHEPTYYNNTTVGPFSRQDDTHTQRNVGRRLPSRVNQLSKLCPDQISYCRGQQNLCRRLSAGVTRRIFGNILISKIFYKAPGDMLLRVHKPHVITTKKFAGRAK